MALIEPIFAQPKGATPEPKSAKDVGNSGQAFATVVTQPNQPLAKESHVPVVQEERASAKKIPSKFPDDDAVLSNQSRMEAFDLDAVVASMPAQTIAQSVGQDISLEIPMLSDNKAIVIPSKMGPLIALDIEPTTNEFAAKKNDKVHANAIGQNLNFTLTQTALGQNSKKPHSDNTHAPSGESQSTRPTGSVSVVMQDILSTASPVTAETSQQRLPASTQLPMQAVQLPSQLGLKDTSLPNLPVSTLGLPLSELAMTPISALKSQAIAVPSVGPVQIAKGSSLATSETPSQATQYIASTQASAGLQSVDPSLTEVSKRGLVLGKATAPSVTQSDSTVSWQAASPQYANPQRPMPLRNVSPGLEQSASLVSSAATAEIAVADAEIDPLLFTEPSNARTTLSSRPEQGLTQAEASPRHVALQVARSVPQSDGSVVEITLDPVELGKVKLTLQAIEGSMQLVLTAERPETLELMRRNTEALAAEFDELGYEDVGFSFEHEERHAAPNKDQVEDEKTSRSHQSLERVTNPTHVAINLTDAGMDLRL